MIVSPKTRQFHRHKEFLYASLVIMTISWMNPWNILKEHEGLTWSWYKYYDWFSKKWQELNSSCTLEEHSPMKTTHMLRVQLCSLMPYHTLVQTTAAHTKEGQTVQQQIRENPNICKKATGNTFGHFFPNWPEAIPQHDTSNEPVAEHGAVTWLTGYQILETWDHKSANWQLKRQYFLSFSPQFVK